ncbi:hypothetical protein NB646_05900 [Oxalobacter aliiformigenes]|uniref:Uncharacterized protein n=1 Tax=Oxalobacter aliiformigenes TaxID=2946593 RepID=A0A9E9NSJ8_9BURK|nr:hypothetical protein [Oxalobacter aliiformigenes]WAV90406.1 hypothetical protein NB646_05900 [Oxalobacter aliiformigenes]
MNRPFARGVAGAFPGNACRLCRYGIRHSCGEKAPVGNMTGSTLHETRCRTTIHSL